jgi:hypothetical protein
MNGFWSNCRCLGDEHLGLVTSIDRIAIFQNTFVALPLKFRLNYGLLIIDRPYRSYPRKERAVLKWTVKKWFFWSNTLSLSKKNYLKKRYSNDGLIWGNLFATARVIRLRWKVQNKFSVTSYFRIVELHSYDFIPNLVSFLTKKVNFGKQVSASSFVKVYQHFNTNLFSFKVKLLPNKIQKINWNL